MKNIISKIIYRLASQDKKIEMLIDILLFIIIYISIKKIIILIGSHIIKKKLNIISRGNSTYLK